LGLFAFIEVKEMYFEETAAILSKHICIEFKEEQIQMKNTKRKLCLLLTWLFFKIKLQFQFFFRKTKQPNQENKQHNKILLQSFHLGK